MTVPRKRPLGCPIERCIAVVSGRWKAMILWRLFVEAQRYSALERLLPNVPQRALSQALAELSNDGVIVRRDDVWALTPLGEAMRPALSGMFAWGSLHQAAEIRFGTETSDHPTALDLPKGVSLVGLATDDVSPAGPVGKWPIVSRTVEKQETAD